MISIADYYPPDKPEKNAVFLLLLNQNNAVILAIVSGGKKMDVSTFMCICEMINIIYNKLPKDWCMWGGR